MARVSVSSEEMQKLQDAKIVPGSLSRFMSRQYLIKPQADQFRRALREG